MSYQIIKPKLTPEELDKYRKRLDRRGGMMRAAEETGLNRNTIRNVALAGTGSDESIAAIRKFIRKRNK